METDGGGKSPVPESIARKELNAKGRTCKPLLLLAHVHQSVSPPGSIRPFISEGIFALCRVRVTFPEAARVSGFPRRSFYLRATSTPISSPTPNAIPMDAYGCSCTSVSVASSPAFALS